jgi:hypothetical protein
MTKEELYKKIIEVYKSTGQGIPGFIKYKIGSQIINELIEEGKIKSIVHQYSYLPNDEYLCLTNQYCVEEDCEKNNTLLPLIFIRNYLGIAEAKGKFTEIISKDSELYSQYLQWIEEHKEDLKFFDSPMVVLVSNTSELSKSTLIFLKGRLLYKKNVTVSEFYNTFHSSSKYKNYNEIINLSNNLCKLYLSEPKYKSNYDELVEKMKHDKKNYNNINQILNFIEKDKNSTEPIQSYIESHININININN